MMPTRCPPSIFQLERIFLNIPFVTQAWDFSPSGSCIGNSPWMSVIGACWETGTGQSWKMAWESGVYVHEAWLCPLGLLEIHLGCALSILEWPAMALCNFVTWRKSEVKVLVAQLYPILFFFFIRASFYFILFFFTIVLDLQEKNVKVVKGIHNSQPVPLLLNSLHLYGTFVTAKKSLGSSPFYSLF